MKILNPLLCALLLGFLSGCIKAPTEEAAAPASSAQVQEALANAWGQADPLSMKENDFLFQETEQRIENNPEPFFVLQEGITVSKKEESPTEFLYTFLYQSKTFKQGEEGSQSTREDHRTVTKASALAVAAMENFKKTSELRPLADDYQMTLGFERLYGLAYACETTDSLVKYCRENLGLDSCEIQCSNLRSEEVMQPVPDLIKTQPNCGGFANCSYRVHKVSFDWSVAMHKNNTVEKQRVNYSVSLSQDLPFLARMTEYCFRQLYPVQNQKVLVTTCTKLKNYRPAP